MKVASYTVTTEKQIASDLDSTLDSPQTAIFVFGSSKTFRNNHELFKKLAGKFPNSHIVGCSGAGEIFQATVLDDSLSLAVVKFDSTSLNSVALPISSYADATALGKDLGKQLTAPDLAGVFVLSEGININGSELIKGISSSLPRGVVVTGGLAGDGVDFKETWTLHKGKLLNNYVVALSFAGKDISVFHGSQGGWDKFGPKRQVTKSKGNVLYSLDGEPALDLYKKYLGARAAELPSSGLLFPLLIEEDSSNDKSYVRTILAVDEANKTMTFAGDIPEGATAQLMKANFDRLVDGAGNAAKQIQHVDPKSDTLAIAISCVGRRLVLKERIEEEVESTLEMLPKNRTKQVGFYSYGEISPIVEGKPCELHNQTMTLTVLQEKPRGR